MDEKKKSARLAEITEWVRTTPSMANVRLFAAETLAELDASEDGAAETLDRIARAAERRGLGCEEGDIWRAFPMPLERCPVCRAPAHATETDDAGLHVGCREVLSALERIAYGNWLGAAHAPAAAVLGHCEEIARAALAKAKGGAS